MPQPIEKSPLAIIHGQVMNDMPQGLYIPPEALEVVLTQFEGPLDLLLYLIRKQNMDLLTIDVAVITEQYVQYIQLMDELNYELAAEYMLMAATLAEMKSYLLLPKIATVLEEEDPTAELMRRLQAYEQVKNLAQKIVKIPQQGRDFFIVNKPATDLAVDVMLPDITLKQLVQAFQLISYRVQSSQAHHVAAEPLSIRSKMEAILLQITQEQTVLLSHIVDFKEGRKGLVVTFIAMLELLKLGHITVMQSENYGMIYLQQAAL